MTVLKHHNVRGLTKRGDTPQYVEEDAEAYTQAELDALFRVCKPNHHLAVFVLSGHRIPHEGSDVPQVERSQLGR